MIPERLANSTVSRDTWEIWLSNISSTGSSLVHLEYPQKGVGVFPYPVFNATYAGGQDEVIFAKTHKMGWGPGPHSIAVSRKPKDLMYALGASCVCKNCPRFVT